MSFVSFYSQFLSAPWCGGHVSLSFNRAGTWAVKGAPRATSVSPATAPAASAASLTTRPSATPAPDLDRRLTQALRSCGDLDLARVDWRHLRRISGRGGATIATQRSCAPLAACWRQTHASSASFFENRHGFAEATLCDARAANLASPIAATLMLGWAPRRGFRSLCPAVVIGPPSSPLIGQSGANGRRACAPTTPRLSLIGWLWRRDFKTQRSSIQESRRVPSLLQRLRVASNADAATANSARQPAKLNELLAASPVMTDEERLRLKVAFAEGYSAASSAGGGGGDGSGLLSDYRGAADGSSYTRLAVALRRLTRPLLVIALLALVLILSPLRSMVQFRMGMEEVVPETVDVSFGDVKGVDEAKQELQDVVAFLREPQRFSALGGQLPKGVLLTGPPGTGKTLLARAVAGEADVPFFHAAGSEFDEVFVGQGARRVRELFRVAKMRAPCVVFIDEIDSVGGKRSGSRLHPYANQTINQLLTEMDGFHSNEGVIVMGATNRRDHLDVALLRPGRFDVEVAVNPPDLEGRRDIFNLYLARVKASLDIDVDVLARQCMGFTGAAIENMVNQAALRAAILCASHVTMQHLDWARDKVTMGAERKSRLPDEETNLMTAYHEGGHTLVALFTAAADPVHKVTIMPRSKSLGHTQQVAAKDRFQMTRQQMVAQLDVLMGGRAAEEIVFGQDRVTTGTSNDLERATSLASAMVRELGMSDRVGLRVIADHTVDDMPSRTVSDNTMDAVDAEVKQMLQESYERAKSLLKAHMSELKALAEALMKHETVAGEDLQLLLKTGSLAHLDMSSPKSAAAAAVSSVAGS